MGYPATNALQVWCSNFSSGLPAWISIDMGVVTTINSYALSVSFEYYYLAPYNWQLQGSNDNSNWTSVDTRTSFTSFADNTFYTFNLSSLVSYRYYRIYCTLAYNGNISGGAFSVTGFALYNSTTTHLNPSSKLHITTVNSAEKGLIIQNVAFQTADLFQFQSYTNSVFSGFNSSGKYYINGGTSTQFLKADGSIDSNSYALSGTLSSYLPLIGGTISGNLVVSGNINTTAYYSGGSSILSTSGGCTYLSSAGNGINLVSSSGASVYQITNVNAALQGGLHTENSYFANGVGGTGHLVTTNIINNQVKGDTRTDKDC